MIEAVPMIQVSNLTLTVVLLLKVATIEQIMKESDAVDYSNPPVIEFITSIKP